MIAAPDPPPPPIRPCGFHVSVRDALVLAAGAVATLLLWDRLGPLALLFPVVLGHFFLFCNLVRLWRRYELIWAAVFMVNLGAWLLSGTLNWWGVLAVQTPLTLALVALQLRSPFYHGVFARRINARLDDFLAGRL